MNLNREQFLKAVERGQTLLNELKKDYPELGLKPVFSRFGPGSGQCDLTTDVRKIVSDFPEMLAEECFSRKEAQNSQKEISNSVKWFRELLIEMKKEESAGREVAAFEAKLLAPDLTIYRGDVLIEYRPENLIYESLQRLQQDSRLSPGLNTVGNIRVIAGSLELLSEKQL
jgi:hypothetical protein